MNVTSSSILRNETGNFDARVGEKNKRDVFSMELSAGCGIEKNFDACWVRDAGKGKISVRAINLQKIRWKFTLNLH